MQSKLQDGSIMICGYVARDAELKSTQTRKSLCRWSVKVGERQNGEQKEAIWVNCQAWHGAARAASAIKNESAGEKTLPNRIMCFPAI